MPIRRVGRPGLIGTAARTAVIAGTAQATAGAVSRRQNARQQRSWEEQQAAAQAEQARIEAAAQQAAAQQAAQAQYAAPAPAAPAAAGQGDLLAQLEKLGQLRSAGVLDDAEFAAAKAKLLG
ncbi:SHOCT domain-containing protein [Cellulosimicrobium marinum]|uniref:SHOCT domain-containing protein n=1 Tax=Cellulosimicrobium marinum TaxID=1638992 RepID=UPI001E4BE378|nr:SHOCT domain-containing protein [Cellulosimicrobium marinum]MCB7135576.1 SHOCT domain-containing protein [Cellulosimicrobium marinum]